MRLKPKRRLILLACIVAVLALGAFAAIFVRKWQRNRLADRSLAEGLAAWKAHHYYDALGLTAAYIKRVHDDPSRLHDPQRADALLVYADSRRRIDEPNGSNYRECISFYQQYLQLRPDDRDAAVTLLKTYNICSLGGEAVNLADQMLPADKNYTAKDIPILRERALGDLSANAFDRVQKDYEAITAIDPVNVQAHAAYFASLEKMGQRDRARATADALLKSHGDDPRALVIAAISREIDPSATDAADAITWARRAAGLDPQTGAPPSTPVAYPSPEFVYSLVEVLDRFRSFDDSLSVLRMATAKLDDAGLLRTFARRLWQLHASDELIRITDNESPTSPDADPDVLAFRALALIDQKRTPDAAAIETALGNRAGDFRARAWAKAIPLMDPARAPKSAVEAAAQWNEIEKINGNESIFKCMLAETYAALGRTPEARELWKIAATYKPSSSWSLPAFRIAQTCLAEGQADDAATWSLTAVQIGQNRLPEVFLWLDAQSAAIQKGLPTAGGMSPEEMLKQLGTISADINAKLPAEQARGFQDRLLIPRIVLLAHSGQRNEALQAARAALDQNPPPSPAILQRLATTSRIENLGVEDQCVKLLAATGGGDAEIASITQNIDPQNPAPALDALRAAAAKNPENLTLQASVPRLLESIGRTQEATAEWAKFGKAHPDSLQVQRMCLQSAAGPLDKQFLDETIVRYRKLSGLDEGQADPIVTIAQARNDLQTEGGRERAVAMLSVLTSRPEAPAQAHILLASALSGPGASDTDILRAIDQLHAVLNDDPRNFAVSLQLAQLLQRKGDYPAAATELRRITSDLGSDAGSQRAAAEMLIHQGVIDQDVADILARAVKQMGDHTPSSTLVMLGEAYATLHKDADADAVYQRLASGAADSIDSIYMTARHYAITRNPEKRQQALALIDHLKTPPTAAERDALLGRLAADESNREGADAHFEAAVAAAPTNAEIWKQYVSAMLRIAQPDDALKIARRAVEDNPKNPELAALLQQILAMSTPAASADLSALIASVSADASAAELVKDLRALESSYKAGRFDYPDQLVNLADRYPRYLGVQIFAMNRLASIAPDRAAALAERTIAAHPADTAPARAAALLYFSLRPPRWEPMLRAAERWQRIDSSRTPEPDLAVAEACLGLNQYQRGMQAIAQRVPAALQNPDLPYHPEVLTMQARLLIASGHEPDARALLAPLLPKSPKVRASWLAIAREVLTDNQQRAVWIDQIRPLITRDHPDEFLAFGMTLYAIGEDQSKPDSELPSGWLHEAGQVFADLAADPKTATAAVFEALGIAQYRAGNYAAAEDAWNKAIALDPKRSASLNNLANVELETHQDFEKALSFAKRAVEADAASPNNLDTLATVYAKRAAYQKQQGDAKAARESLVESGKAYSAKASLTRDGVDAYNAGVQFDDGRAFDQARTAYRAVISFGVPTARMVLLATAKNNLAMDLIRQEKPSRAELLQASSLVSQAIQINDEPAYSDTRGWICLASGDARGAEQAFAHALDALAAAKQAPISSSIIGRATALAQLGRKPDAAKLLQSVNPAGLEPEDRAHYDAAMAAVKPL